MITQRRFVTLLFGAATSGLLASTAMADCTRHVYNRSLNVWAYGFHADPNTVLGDDDKTIILPSETDTIEYASDAAASGDWLIVLRKTDVDGKPDYRRTFQVSGCYLQHDGVTGEAVLNSPADGDIIFID